MCGITGIINKKGSVASGTILKQMNDLIAHRGPNAEGYYCSKSVGLAHRRLSVLDLVESANQPMDYNDYTITYNGEVYNYVALKKELEEKGYIFKSETDTEVVLAAYQEWGEKCVDYFNGMWAFAIYDRRNNTVFLSRDRFGIKPLYYYSDETHFYFGSEIKQLLHFIERPKVNRQILFDFLYLSYHHHTDNTFFEGIYALAPAHNLIFNLETNSFIVKKYYELPLPDDLDNAPFEESLMLYKEKITRAIQLQMRADVMVGACLSGGLDSSFIAATAAQILKENSLGKLTAITAKSIEKKTDESKYAKMVADACDLKWYVTGPTEEDFLDSMDEVIKIQEEPFGGPSVIMQYFVMKKAKEAGCVVLLDGQGGDETLLGYERYFISYLNEQKGLFKKIKAYFQISNNSKLSLIKLLFYSIYFNNVYVRKFRQLHRNKYIKKEYKKYLHVELLHYIAKSTKSLRALQKAEIEHIQLQKLLKYEDRNSMSQSIEARVPFLDHEVVETALSLPFSHKINSGWSKFILRKSAENLLPGEVIWRKNKVGFEAPHTWMANKQHFLNTITKSGFINRFATIHLISDKTDALTLWKLYNIAVWSEKFNVSF
jgi:asparagine synthase (glutamine-hydrolysing)